jgi:hypothetical protein
MAQLWQVYTNRYIEVEVKYEKREKGREKGRKYRHEVGGQGHEE